MPDRLEELRVAAKKLGEEREKRRQRARELHEEARALYVDKNGDPVLRPSFAIYLDEMGAAARYESMTDDDLRSQLALLDRYRWFLHDEAWEGDFQRFLSFSDNVVVGSPIFPDSPGGMGLGLQLGSVIGYQLNLAAKGYFLRGAIAAGDLYMDERIVAGPALIEAVRLEEAVALYPRVVLSDVCVELVLEDLRSYSSGFSSPWNEQLLVDADSRIFLNYLIGVAGDEIPGQIDAGLREHKKSISQNLVAFPTEGRVREKYVWAAHYHNFVQREFFPESGEFRIEEELSALERAYPRQFRLLVSVPKNAGR